MPFQLSAEAFFLFYNPGNSFHIFFAFGLEEHLTDMRHSQKSLNGYRIIIEHDMTPITEE